jgi:hypothetical protein
MPETCATLYTKALHYLCAKTQHWPTATRQAAIHDPAVQQAHAQIEAAWRADDPRACAAACKGWWGLVLRHAPHKAQEVTP